MNAKLISLYLIIFVILVAACAPPPARINSDSGVNYDYETSIIEIDENIYNIEGYVAGDVNSLVRQTSPASGSMIGINGYMSGSYMGPEFDGKGFVRVNVKKSDSDLAPVGSLVILKTTDTKVIMLYPGDYVQFKCRKQQEGIAALKVAEEFRKDEASTYELDYCRLVTPVILPAPTLVP